MVAAFYQHRIPAYLSDSLFTPGLTAGRLAMTDLYGRKLEPTDVIFPQLAVAPMGWSWALCFIQRAHTKALASSDGMDMKQMMADFHPPTGRGARSGPFVVR